MKRSRHKKSKEYKNFVQFSNFYEINNNSPNKLKSEVFKFSFSLYQSKTHRKLSKIFFLLCIQK